MNLCGPTGASDKHHDISICWVDRGESRSVGTHLRMVLMPTENSSA